MKLTVSIIEILIGILFIIYSLYFAETAKIDEEGKFLLKFLSLICGIVISIMGIAGLENLK